MMDTTGIETRSTHAPVEGRVAGVILAAASIASVVLMAHHPTVSMHAMTDVVEELGRKARVDGIVHGSLIALLGSTLFGLTELSVRLGLGRSSVRAGLFAYSIGAIAMIGAALVSGFVVPDLATRYDHSGASNLEALRHLLVLCTVANRTLASFGAVGMSAGIVAWSFALVRAPRAGRVIGALGLVVGAGVAIALLSGVLKLEVAGMSIVVVAQGAWNVALAIQLVRGRI